MAALLPLSAFHVNADEKPIKQDIPINPVRDDTNNRSLIQQPIECCYIGIMNIILTTFNVDLGDVYIEVMNITTGETENVSFDSGNAPQISLPISGKQGLHIVTIVTESGNVYEGSFTI